MSCSLIATIVRHALFIVSVALLLPTFEGRSQESKENSEFRLAVNLYNDGMYDLAVEQLKSFVTAYPTTSQSIEARLYLGQTQMKLKHFDEARVTFQNFALSYVDHPRAAEAWVNVALAFSEVGNIREAASAYERVRVFQPKSPLVPDALTQAAVLYRRVGERDRAKKALRTVVQDYSSSKSVLAARLAISEMYAEEGQTDLAMREARRVSESDAPAIVKGSALFSLGKMQSSAALFTEATSTFQLILAGHKGTTAASMALFELASVELIQGKYATAIDRLKLVVDDRLLDDSVRTSALFFLADAYDRQHEYSNAVRTFEKLASRSPAPERALLGAARVSLNASNPAGALKFAKRLLVQPGSMLKREALAVAARAATQANQYAEAAQYYRTFADEFPADASSSEMLYRLGELYRSYRSDYRSAIAVFTQVMERDPQSHLAPQAAHQLGRCQIALRENESALTTFSSLLSTYPAYEKHAEIVTVVDSLKLFAVSNRDIIIQKLTRLMSEVLFDSSKAALSYQLGLIYFNDLKDFVAAEQQFSVAIAKGLAGQDLADASYLLVRARHLTLADSSGMPEIILAYDDLVKRFPASTWSAQAAYVSFVARVGDQLSTDIVTATNDFFARHPLSENKLPWHVQLARRALERNAPRLASQFLGGALGTAGSSEVMAELLYVKGQAYSMLGFPDSAVLCWREAIGQSPGQAYRDRAMRSLATYYESKNNYAAAVELWKRLSNEFSYALEPGDQEKTGAAYVVNGDYDEAIEFYQRVRSREVSSQPLSVNNMNSTALFRLGTAFEGKGDRQSAMQSYREYLRREYSGAHSGESYYRLGRLAQAQGGSTLATLYFKEASARGGAGSATREIADLLFQTEQYVDAARQYTLLSNAPDSIITKQSFAARAIVATLRGGNLPDAEKQISEFEKTYGKKTPSAAEFSYERGSYFYSKQEYANAKKMFEVVAGEFGETRLGPWGHYYLGKILEVQNKLDDAAKKFEGILKNSPQSDVLPRVLLSLGNMHFNAERFEKSIAYYQRITDAPDKAGEILSYAMNNLIEAYESTKLYDAAIKTTRDYLERFPNDEGVIEKKITLGSLYTKVGYYDQAILQFQNLLDEAGSSLEAELRYNIGEACYYKGDYQQALLEFLKVPYLVSKQGRIDWIATAFYMAGQSYEKMSKFDEAIGMYQQIIDRSGIDATFKAGARKEIDRVKTLLRKSSK